MATTTRTPANRAEERTYGQYCPVAAGLDVIGDRWVLLILRELSMGDRRFTDLRRDLPGIAPNLLSDRLRSLQRAGIVETAELPPPAARTVYRLTSEGRGVIPVLRSVARFGVRFLDGEPSDRFDARRAAYALLIPWWTRNGAPVRARLRLARPSGAAGADTVDVVVADDRLRVEEPGGDPDVTFEVALADLVATRRTGAPVAARLTGAPALRRTFLAQFDLALTTTAAAAATATATATAGPPPA
jgi:DNA-binding HxlR family transcriptional regulator